MRVRVLTRARVGVRRAHLHVVERVHDHRESAHKGDAEARVADVAKMRHDLHVRRELRDGVRSDLRLRAADVLRAEEELPVQIRHVDRVQVDDLRGRGRRRE